MMRLLNPLACAIKCKEAISIIALLLSSFVLGAVLSVGLYWAYAPINPPFQIVSEPIRDIELVKGNLLVRSHVKIQEPVEVTSKRQMELIDEKSQEHHIVILPTSSIKYEPGDYSITQPIALPHGLQPGLYSYKSRVTWVANPFRQGEIKLPPLRVYLPSNYSHYHVHTDD